MIIKYSEHHLYDSVQTFPVGGEYFYYRDGRRFLLLPEHRNLVEDRQGQVWCYKGIGSKADNMFRVKGWEKC